MDASSKGKDFGSSLIHLGNPVLSFLKAECCLRTSIIWITVNVKYLLA
jgi:hypothetical protein